MSQTQRHFPAIAEICDGHCMVWFRGRKVGKTIEGPSIPWPNTPTGSWKMVGRKVVITNGALWMLLVMRPLDAMRFRDEYEQPIQPGSLSSSRAGQLVLASENGRVYLRCRLMAIRVVTPMEVVDGEEVVGIELVSLPVFDGYHHVVGRVKRLRIP